MVWCLSAIINGTIQPLKYALQNGDVVEILRTAGSKPKPDWIKVVRTGRAATRQELEESLGQVLVKAAKGVAIQPALREWVGQFTPKGDTRLSVDIDPQSFY